MNSKLFSLLALSAFILSASPASAQCKKFSRNRVINAFDGDIAIDQITSGTIGRGERASALIEVESTGEVDLIISTHPDLGEVSYSVISTSGERLVEGSLDGTAKRMPLNVQAEVDLIVHIASELPSSAYTPIGCVSLATTKVIPNEMDILIND